MDCAVMVPYTDGDAVAYLRENAVIHTLDYVPEGVKISLLCRQSDAGRYEKYIFSRS